MRDVVLVGVVSLVAFAAGVLSASLGHDRPDAVLRPQDSDAATDVMGLPVASDHAERTVFESVGALGVLSLRAEETVCLVLRTEDGETASACDTADGFGLGMDVVVSDESRDVASTGLFTAIGMGARFTESATGYPDGTRLRFILRDDGVEVWTSPPEEP